MPTPRTNARSYWKRRGRTCGRGARYKGSSIGPMACRGGAFALVVLCMVELALPGAGAAAGERLVPAMFVFGDSTVDVGNNNLLPDCKPECRANYLPYGIDYPSHAPTGRFSNGYNLADQIAKYLGFNESPPAFRSLPAEGIILQMKDGINFASGGSGLQNKTGVQRCGRVYSMANQLEEFTQVVQRMGNSSYDLISRSLFFISVGSNDLFEYADADSPPPNRSDTAFLERLVDSYKAYLQELYAAGARKFGVVSPSLLGCCPSQRAMALQKNDTDGLGCFRAPNNLSKQLYLLLASMLQDLSGDLDGMNYSLCDSAGLAEAVFKLLGGTKGSNLTELGKACCAGQWQGPCEASAKVCPNRASFMFWDGFHPTDGGSALAAITLFYDPGFFVDPINVGQLAKL